jgi:hypothetical protein
MPRLALATLAISGVALSLAHGSSTPRETAAEVGSAAPTSSPPTPNVDRGAAVSTPPISPPVALDARTRGWEVGTRYTYEVALTTVVTFEGNGNDFDFDLFGGLEVEPTRVGSDSTLLHAVLTGVRFVSRQPESQGELEKLALELRSKGAFVTFAGGRATELRVPKDMSQMAASMYRHVTSALQFSHASDGAQSYTAEEYDTIGPYVAEYSLLAGGSVWHKRKQRYLGILGRADLPGDMASRLVPKVTDSRGQIRLSAGGVPENVELFEQMTLSGAEVPVRSTFAITLRALKVRPSAALPSKLETALTTSKRFLADEPIPDVDDEGALDRAKIGTLDFDSIVRSAELGSNATRPGTQPGAPDAGTQSDPEDARLAETRVREQARHFHALTAMFRTDPQSVLKAVQKIRGGSAASDTLMDALGSAGTPAAHAALGQLLGSTAVSPEVEGRIVMALARSPQPTREAGSALRAVLEKDPFHPGALYGLGTHARLYRDAGASRESAAIGAFLMTRLELAPGAMSLSTVLRAVANSGYAAGLPRIQPYLRDERARIRAAAVRALQSMQDPRVDPLIAARIRDDESPEVQRSAIEAAKLREPSEFLAAALAEASASSIDRHVRYSVIELMVLWLPKRPELRGILERVAKEEAEPKIREQAQAAL